MNYLLIKRAADILVSFSMLIVFAPILAITAIIIRLTSPGPVFFRQTRFGKNRQPFTILKFRTMVHQAALTDQPEITAADDQRITPFGKILRATKLDEFPQLINVLNGQMSFVGPRPNVRKFVENYKDEELKVFEIPQGVTDFASLWFREQERILVKSGTGDAEKDYREFVEPDKKRLQLKYSQEIGFATDLKIFVATILAITFKINPIWCFPKSAREPLIKI